MSKHPKQLSENDKKILIEFYKIQWNDIFDMNSLDWRVALIFIPLVSAFSAVVGILSQWLPQEMEKYTLAIQFFGVVVFLLCLYGLWTVAKGQAHTILKFRTLDCVEKDLCLHKYVHKRSQSGRFWSVFVCRRFLLYVVYSVLAALSLAMAVVPIDGWSFHPMKLPIKLFMALFVAIVFAVFIIWIHYLDYKLYLN